MPSLEILIVGGGIAGISLAFWLSKLGHSVTLIERFSSLRATGLQIDLRGHGVEVMKRMGLEADFRAKAAPENGLQIVDKTGKRRAFFPANKTGKGIQSFTSEWEIMRGDLCRIIHAACEERVKWVFDTSIENMQEAGDNEGVKVLFTDGKRETFDLVVGADGQGSHTRKLMLGVNAPEAFIPIPGSYIGYFTIRSPIKDGEEYIATTYIAPGGRSILYRRHSPHATQAYLICETSSDRLQNARGKMEEEKAAIKEIFQGAGWRTEEILKGLEKADDFYVEHLGLVKLDAWSKGSIALVGDAAYCPSANTGMGVTSAMVGAFVLAGEIGRHCASHSNTPNSPTSTTTQQDIRAALQAYEEKFRPFMDQVQKGVLENKANMPTSRFGIEVANCVLGIAAFFRLNVFGWILKEDVRGWEMPEYEEMLK